MELKKDGYIQYWSNGIMLTARMDPETAQKWVDYGEAYIISPQAIGKMRNGVKMGGTEKEEEKEEDFEVDINDFLDKPHFD